MCSEYMMFCKIVHHMTSFPDYCRCVFVGDDVVDPFVLRKTDWSTVFQKEQSRLFSILSEKQIGPLYSKKEQSRLLFYSF
jgi:hypothetical protein